MSNSDERIAQLEGQLRAAQELLFLTLDYIGEPVVLDVEESKKRLSSDRMIGLDLDEAEGKWRLEVVDLNA